MGNARPALAGWAVRYPCGRREVAPTGKLRRDPRLRLPMPPRPIRTKPGRVAATEGRTKIIFVPTKSPRTGSTWAGSDWPLDSGQQCNGDEQVDTCAQGIVELHDFINFTVIATFPIVVCVSDMIEFE